jgi:hypothetical protein
MGEEDVFPAGYVIRGRSTTFPDAIVDFALPSAKTPEKFEYAAGQVLKIEESTTCAALLHIDRLEEGTMIFTAVPLVEREYLLNDAAKIAVTPPPLIRIEPERWPISKEEEAIEAKPVSFSPASPEAAEAAKKGERDGADDR